IPPNVSVGIDELSRTSAGPSKEAWIPVIGNPNFSKTGNSEASAVTAPNTTITVLVIESNLRMLSSIYLNLFAALAKQDSVCARSLMHCRNRPGGTNVINSQNLGDGRGLAAL